MELRVGHSPLIDFFIFFFITEPLPTYVGSSSGWIWDSIQYLTTVNIHSFITLDKAQIVLNSLIEESCPSHLHQRKNEFKMIFHF